MIHCKMYLLKIILVSIYHYIKFSHLDMIHIFNVQQKVQERLGRESATEPAKLRGQLFFPKRQR